MHTIVKEVVENLIRLHPESLVGAIGKKSYEAFEKNSHPSGDLDLLVIDEQYQIFEREVVQHENLEVDISYISEELLHQQVAAGSVIWTDVVKRFEKIYKGKENTFLRILALQQAGRKNKPGLTAEEIKFIRFDLKNNLQYLSRQKHDQPQSHYLKNNYLTALIEAYFQLTEPVIPKGKKQLSILKEKEPILYKMIEDFYKKDSKQSYEILEKMTDHVLRHVGGPLLTFEKGVYPIDR